MSESKHTPAPWLIGDLAFTHFQGPEGLSEGRLAASIHHGAVSASVPLIRVGAGRDDDADEVMANARLIAAAPELLEALRAAEDFMAGFEGDELQEGIDERLTTVRAAIAKAEGGL